MNQSFEKSVKESAAAKSNHQKNRKSRIQALKTALADRILVIDGAMGTMLQQKNLTAEDFGGPDLEGCNENLILTRPDVVEDIYETYLKAGADIIESNTFGGTPLVLDEYGLASKAYEINYKATNVARVLCDKYSTPSQPRFVAGVLGPTTKAISVTGGVTFEELINQFYQQAKGLYDGGADYFLIETSQDTRNIKAALLGIDRLQDQKPEDERLPIAVSLTIEPMGTMLAGQGVEAAAASLSHRDLLYIGLNCATGPEFMTDHIRTLSRQTRVPVSCVPNAGLPDENGKYLETPEMVAQVVGHFAEQGWLNVIGGCCGTHAGHIKALRQVADKNKPRRPSDETKSTLSGIDYLEVLPENRPIIVGERTNVIGSKKFKELIIAERFEEAAEVGRAQVKAGAQIVDVCLANPDRDELADMRQFLEKAIKVIKVPLMIDSTDERVIELALTYCQGKAIINSINLEDGEERFEKVVPLAKKYGAALVVGTIDEDPVQGMAVSRERKLEVARRCYDLLTTKYGIAAEDIYFDPLVFPCATGDEQYVGSAVETIEGIRLIKQAFPKCKTVLGISNVSFGLPAAGREVLNSVFLYHCVQSGLDLAIVNSQKMERYASIPEEERKLSEDLLWNRGADPIATFAAHFRTVKREKKSATMTLPLMERLPRYIIEGSKDGLIEDLDLALKEMKPLEVINGPLMKGMDEVGRLFNNNELIVAEVLQSAEVMKAAVAHLEPHMDKADGSAERGRVLLATVKGDVHDIGKNLVDIILSNNGFKVVNLGIKIPPEQIIAAVKEHKPDIIGLSGLLVKSAQQMVTTAEDLARAEVQVPVMVGGAALSRNFVDRQIAPAYGAGTVVYAKDAMNGLEIAKRIMDPEQFRILTQELERQRKELAERGSGPELPKKPEMLAVRSEAVPVVDAPQAPDGDRHVLKNTPIDQIWAYINPLMLYGRHLGIKGGVVRQLAQGKFAEIPEEAKKSIEIWHAVEEVKVYAKANGLIAPKAVYQYFSAQSKGNSIYVAPLGESNPMGVAQAQFEFPRQLKQNGLCLADYVNPHGSGVDNIALFVVTAAEGVRAKAEEWKAKGDYLKSHVIQALALETAEAYAEWLHGKLRALWGYPDPIGTTMMDRFQAKYRGKRYSFGYPACPRLSDQEILFQLLHPEDIGVQLTEGYMMDPEASVSAIVFHHPAATYFSVGSDAEENRQ
jgi:5-methyltetrahydrofolate--homocysteine methyltransferase